MVHITMFFTMFLTMFSACFPHASGIYLTGKGGIFSASALKELCTKTSVQGVLQGGWGPELLVKNITVPILP